MDDSKRELELTVQKRVQASLTEIRSQAKHEADAASALVLQEKEIQLAGMRRQIEDLKRRSEQGSQQLQGEAQELQLEQLLSGKFPYDLIEPVGKGEFGGDVLHHVAGPESIAIGTILWESKRTKNWSDSWLPKLRNDQRRAKADIAILVSQALPKGMSSFDLIDGVWVTESRCAVPVAIALSNRFSVWQARDRPLRASKPRQHLSMSTSRDLDSGIAWRRSSRNSLTCRTT